MLLSSRDPVNPHRNHSLSGSSCRGSLPASGTPRYPRQGGKNFIAIVPAPLRLLFSVTRGIYLILLRLIGKREHFSTLVHFVPFCPPRRYARLVCGFALKYRSSALTERNTDPGKLILAA